MWSDRVRCSLVLLLIELDVRLFYVRCKALREGGAEEGGREGEARAREIEKVTFFFSTLCRVEGDCSAQ